MALLDWPLLNSSLSKDGTAVIQHAAHNLGVAMATPLGLVVSAVNLYSFTDNECAMLNPCCFLSVLCA